MSEDTGVAAPSPTPSPTPEPAPASAPGDTIVVPLRLGARAIAALRQMGVLGADQPSAEDIEAAVMTVLGAAWRTWLADARAAEEAPPAPPPAEVVS